MKMEIELSDIQINDVVRDDLIESYKILVEGSVLFETDNELVEALDKVIEYYSNKDQFEEFRRTYMKQVDTSTEDKLLEEIKKEIALEVAEVTKQHIEKLLGIIRKIH